MEADRLRGAVHAAAVPRRRKRVIVSAVACAVAAGLAAGVADDGWAAPEGRAYELVSVENTDNAAALAVRATDDGEKVLLAHDAIGDDVGGVPQFALVLAQRGTTGWSARPFGSPSAIPLGSGINALPRLGTADLSGVVVESTVALDARDVDSNKSDVYALFVDGGPARWLSFGATVPDGLTGGANVGGAAADLSTVIFKHQDALLPGVPANQLYARRGDQLEVVSILPDGTYATSPNFAAPPGVESGHDGTTTALASAFERPHRGPGAVSADGSRVFFYGAAFGSSPIYMRDLATGSTVAVTASKRPGEESDPPASGRFVAATDDGTAVVFLSNAPLTADAPANGGLYRYDVDTDTLTLLVENTSTATNGGAVYAIASEDLSHVYFISTNTLLPGASGRSLYVWSSARGLELAASNVGNNARLARVSRDGRYVVFRTTSSLGGAANNGKAAIYLYDAEEKQLACASCRPDGRPSQSAATLSTITDKNFPTTGSWELVVPRNITDDGRVFFETDEALLEADVNTAVDVYEYDHGTIRLISPGTSPRPSFLGDNSDDGRTVFIMTHDALVPEDRDAGAVDVYAVRVDGGFPEAPARTSCEGDACQGAFMDRPSLQTPGSGAEGTGNVVPPPDVPGAPFTRSVRIEPLSSAALRSAARRGVLTVRLRVTGGGTVRLKASARLGGRTRTVGSVTSVVKQTRAVTRTVRIRLSAAARRELRRGKRVRVTLAASLSGADGVRQRTVTLARTAR